MSFEPDLKWYSKISAKRGLATRCPYASVFRCPRYYQSLSLLGHAGSTEIEPEKDQQLKARWEQTDLWPVTVEQATSVSGPSERRKFNRFCPEVMYDRFNLFVEDLYPYYDESERERIISSKGSNCAEWEYRWAVLSELHYSDCNMYSLLREKGQQFDAALNANEIIEWKPGIFGINVNLKTLLTRFCVWWLKRIRKKQNGVN